MSAGGIELELVRHLHLGEGGMIDFVAGDMCLIVLTMNDQSGWNLGLEVWIRGNAAIFVVQVGRVNKHGEIRPAALFIDRIDSRVGSLVELGACFRRDISTGREANDTKSVGVNFLRCRIRT